VFTKTINPHTFLLSFTVYCVIRSGKGREMCKSYIQHKLRVENVCTLQYNCIFLYITLDSKHQPNLARRNTPCPQTSRKGLLFQGFHWNGWHSDNFLWKVLQTLMECNMLYLSPQPQSKPIHSALGKRQSRIQQSHDAKAALMLGRGQQSPAGNQKLKGAGPCFLFSNKAPPFTHN